MNLGGDTPVVPLRYTKSAPCFYSASPQGANQPFSLSQFVEAAQIGVMLMSMQEREAKTEQEGSGVAGDTRHGRQKKKAGVLGSGL